MQKVERVYHSKMMQSRYSGPGTIFFHIASIFQTTIQLTKRKVKCFCGEGSIMGGEEEMRGM